MTPAPGPSGDGLLVYGLGRSGLAVVERARALDLPVAFYEARPGGADVERAQALGCHRVTDLATWLEHGQASGTVPAQAIAAPGVRIDHPDLELLRRAGVEVIGEVEWVWRLVPGRYVGVTGTAGKGSVTRWCGDTLAAAGVEVEVGGNIVPALAAVARPGALHMVEMSSFQLERCPTFAPDVAVILNLGEDHIDRHGSVAAYHRAKKNLLANLGEGHTLVINADDVVLRDWAEEAEARGVRVLRFSLERQADAHLAEDGQIHLAGRALLPRGELQVRGDHQVANALATALVAWACGLERQQIGEGLRAFQGVPGRYSPAGAVGNVRFIEDSIATRPLAVAAALRASERPLVWLAGGQAKGADLAGLSELVADRVDLLLTFGESADVFARAYEGLTEIERVKEGSGEATMRSLVDRALRYLAEHHGGAGTVLLSPLATSFDQFSDYKARGAAFRRAVEAAAGPGDADPSPAQQAGASGQTKDAHRPQRPTPEHA